MTDRAKQLLPLVVRMSRKAHAVKLADGPRWIREPFTQAKLAGHLSGAGKPCGLCPIAPGTSTTKVAMLDFDDHNGDLGWDRLCTAVGEVVETLRLLDYEPTLFRSSGGKGVHLFLLWEDDQDAHSVREFLKMTLAACWLEDGTGGVINSQCEIFPKQSSVTEGSLGSMFILPLAGESVPLGIVAD